MHGHYNILFLCTANSARSIMAEAVTNGARDPRINAFSAGSTPSGTVHPVALDLLRTVNLPTEGLRSKSWNEFAAPDAPHMDIIITVCDRAAGESCPVWPGHPLTSHWSVPDPAATTGSALDVRNAFREALRILQRRIEFLTNFPNHALDNIAMRNLLDEVNARWAAEAARPRT